MHFIHQNADRYAPSNYHLKPPEGFESHAARRSSHCTSHGSRLSMAESGSNLHESSQLLEESSEDSFYSSTVDLTKEHDCQHEGCGRVTINVSGMKFETQLRTLNRLPNTLLGDPEKRIKYWNESRKEYFFDRYRPAFPAILYYYQSGGRMKCPLEVPFEIFMEELYFFELGHHTINSLKVHEGYILDEVQIKPPRNTIQRKIWTVMECPESSFLAKVVALMSVVFIWISVIIFCIETLPSLKDIGCRDENITAVNGTVRIVKVPDFTNALFIIESLCIMWFVLEMVIRILVAPSKLEFAKAIANWIDLVSILPYFIFLGLTLSLGECHTNNKSGILSVLRVLRVARVFKLSKHSEGLKVLGKTLKTSLKELFMFAMFLAIATVIFSAAVFYAELDQDHSQFESIPSTFYWTIVTMSTVGYGDYVPVGILGKILGGFCAVSGVLTIALPVPVIVANFNTFYKQSAMNKS
ncbi:potassium voltage-gated channel subfamily A member 1 [Patella vulgata]|uniref:potassium voltage-gated channel subfamily A member 1 n=1 Tax=Patella vulgata TaxID=6465 RepID=UPI0024A98E97|nr:potassium voltage-gated channel subfamily A member 1 [Patella vulgata]